MKSAMLWSLVILNAVLCYALVARVPSAHAAGAPGRPSDYLLIPGDVPGGANEVVYIVDTSNGILGGMAYDPSTKQLQVMKALDLNKIFQAGR